MTLVANTRIQAWKLVWTKWATFARLPATFEIRNAFRTGYLCDKFETERLIIPRIKLVASSGINISGVKFDFSIAFCPNGCIWLVT